MNKHIKRIEEIKNMIKTKINQLEECKDKINTKIKESQIDPSSEKGLKLKKNMYCFFLDIDEFLEYNGDVVHINYIIAELIQYGVITNCNANVDHASLTYYLDLYSYLYWYLDRYIYSQKHPLKNYVKNHYYNILCTIISVGSMIAAFLAVLLKKID